METVAAVGRRMRDRQVGAVIGIITDRDLVIRVLAVGLDPSVTSIGDEMTPSPTTVAEDACVETALGYM